MIEEAENWDDEKDDEEEWDEEAEEQQLVFAWLIDFPIFQYLSTGAEPKNRTILQALGERRFVGDVSTQYPLTL